MLEAKVKLTIECDGETAEIDVDLVRLWGRANNDTYQDAITNNVGRAMVMVTRQAAERRGIRQI